MKANKLIVVMAVFLLVLVTVVGCGSKSGQDQSGSEGSSVGGGNSNANAEPIKIGVIGDYSGGSVDMGVAMRNGIEMATIQLNENGGINGRKVELVKYDDEGNPTKATTGAQKLIESDNVVAILGNPNTGTAIATTKVSREMKVPQIVPIAQSPEVLEPASPWIFRITATNPMDIEKMISYVKEKGWTKVGLLYDTSAYGMSGKKILDVEVPKAGLEIVASEGYTVGAPDLTPQVLNLKNANAQAVLMWGLGADEGRFVSNVDKIGWDVPIIGGRGTIFKIFTEIGGKAADGTIATASLNFDDSDVKAFMEEYEERFKTLGSIDFAALGYDAANTLFEALKRSESKGEITRDSVLDAIESIDKFETVTGPTGYAISFGPEKHEGASPEAVVLVVHENGKWVLLK